ncbi:MAG: sulfotransferase [Rhodospirillaceae bacterium]
MDNRHDRRHLAKARAREVEKLMREARKAMQEGDAVQAERLCREAIGVDPLAADPHHLMAHIAYGQGRLQSAGEHILEAATRDDANVDIHADCGAIMNMLGRAAEAEAACRHVIENRPRHVEAWNNLSVALDLQGRRSEALEACDEALRIRADYVDALVNKGSLLVKTGELVSAIETLAEAAQLAPENPLARVNLAAALRGVGEAELACEQSLEAVRIKPDYPEAHGALGDSLAATGHFEQALDAYDKALELRPGFMAVRLNKAAALFKLGRLDAAMAAYRAIIDDFPGSADAHNGLGVVELAAGRLDAAIKSFRTAVEIDPRQGAAWAALASAPGYELTVADRKAIAALSEDSGLPAAARIAGQFALAETLDRKGDFDAAFERFHAGNEMRKMILAGRDQIFDIDALREAVDDIIAAFPADPAGQGGISDDARPVFVVGMPRSGTTLVEQILASHPDVFGAGEAISIAGLDPQVEPAENVARALERLGAGSTDAKRIVDKTPFQFFHLGLIRRLFPKAAIVHCRRDPLDTGLSCYMQNFTEAYPWSCDLGHIGGYIDTYLRLMAHWRNVLGGAMVEIDYELLVSEPEPHIRRLLEAVGLDWNPACLEFHRTDRVVYSASNWQVRQPLYRSAVGRVAHYDAHLAPLREALGRHG